ncbi:hypothetical protein OPAG_03950 [Rhodococcus opacus PD630]|jgi:hypothetical protein|uniref:hypothetical protein n=1 Tax=Rhodococcus TaxID=1827 RepID=UPI00029CD0F3|nr:MULTISPECIES: hypothetical protein [Rhodococcus]RZK68830.1 MAG: hypothetical protein EOP25_13890 [Rhodococcus sp. (in: high G+C Gram-positive bacteria)]AHK30842.1 hypothetical protein Pd630_LPD03629 [Rhodococcus opacus PD630]EHI47142.1 hypothetical protein OPAG_03950 [Rhodococcus opacus PD630]KXX58733.1 hypothetical protein AZG88_44395 [Rhodococcus sp. LB1]UDH00406.1 hypothetical protein K2Z90_003463 [Rhodococcus opacus PD630]
MTAILTRNRIGQFVRRSNKHGYRTGQWAQIVMPVPVDNRDCWLVIYQDGETDVIPIDNHSDQYTFSSEPVDWQH